MEAVARGHSRISQIVLDTGASKDLVLDTGAGKDLDSIVARDEGDLPEVGFMGMHDSEDVGFDFACRVKVFNWTLARCSWWLVQAFGAGELLSIHIQQSADVCASATRGLCVIIPKAKQLSYLQQKWQSSSCSYCWPLCSCSWEPPTWI